MSSDSNGVDFMAGWGLSFRCHSGCHWAHDGHRRQRIDWCAACGIRSGEVKAPTVLAGICRRSLRRDLAAWLEEANAQLAPYVARVEELTVTQERNRLARQRSRRDGVSASLRILTARLEQRGIQRQ
jgi:hypothetical protein